MALRTSPFLELLLPELRDNSAIMQLCAIPFPSHGWPPLPVGTAFTSKLSRLAPAWTPAPALSQLGPCLATGPTHPDMDQDTGWLPILASDLSHHYGPGWWSLSYIWPWPTSPDLILRLVCPAWCHGLLVRTDPRHACSPCLGIAGWGPRCVTAFGSFPLGSSQLCRAPTQKEKYSFNQKQYCSV